MLKNGVITWKTSRNCPLVKNVVAMANASHQSPKFLCQNNPNKILLKVRKYLGTNKNSLEVILRKLPGGKLPPAPPPPLAAPGMNRVERNHKKSSSYIHSIIYKDQKPHNYLTGAFYSSCYLIS